MDHNNKRNENENDIDTNTPSNVVNELAPYDLVHTHSNSSANKSNNGSIRTKRSHASHTSHTSHLSNTSNTSNTSKTSSKGSKIRSRGRNGHNKHNNNNNNNQSNGHSKTHIDHNNHINHQIPPNYESNDNTNDSPIDEDDGVYRSSDADVNGNGNVNSRADRMNGMSREEEEFYTVFSDDVTLEDIRIKMSNFVNEREWNQYHTPRNLLLAMVGEVGELSEIFQWRGELKPGLPSFNIKDKIHLGEEIADVALYLIRLADRCGINLTDAILDKMKKNAKKYPAHLARGSSAKYTKYIGNGLTSNHNQNSTNIPLKTEHNSENESKSAKSDERLDEHVTIVPNKYQPNSSSYTSTTIVPHPSHPSHPSHPLHSSTHPLPLHPTNPPAHSTHSTMSGSHSITSSAIHGSGGGNRLSSSLKQNTNKLWSSFTPDEVDSMVDTFNNNIYPQLDIGGVNNINNNDDLNFTGIGQLINGEIFSINSVIADANRQLYLNKSESYEYFRKRYYDTKLVSRMKNLKVLDFGIENGVPQRAVNPLLNPYINDNNKRLELFIELLQPYFYRSTNIDLQRKIDQIEAMYGIGRHITTDYFNSEDYYSAQSQTTDNAIIVAQQPTSVMSSHHSMSHHSNHTQPL